jgi:hypothetical protein
MSVYEFVKINCQKSTGDEFSDRLKAGLMVQGELDECEAIWFHRGIENPDEFILQLQWTTVDAHNAWKASEGLQRWRGHISDLLDGLPHLLGHYQTVAQVK